MRVRFAIPSYIGGVYYDAGEREVGEGVELPSSAEIIDDPDGDEAAPAKAHKRKSSSPKDEGGEG